MVASGEQFRPRLTKISMISPAVVTPDQRQQELRAKALDEKFDAERRAIGERVAVMFRWIFLAVLGALINLTPITLSSDPNARLTAFGVVFLFLVVALATGYMTRELERERRQAVRRAAQADQLREVSSDISGDTNIKDVFAVVVAHALQMTGAASASMVLASPDGFAVVATSTSQPLSEGVSPDGLEDSQLARVARSGEASFSDDKSAMVIAMASNEGITALLSLKRPGQQFSNQDLFAVDALSGSSAVAMANALRYHRSTQEATTDALTGLYNVRELRRRLDAVFARPDKATMAVSLLLLG